MRLFVAIPLPQTVLTQLDALRRPTWSDVRWEHPYDSHITLRFIGDVDQARYDVYQQALKTVQQRPFTLNLQGVGHFPADASRGLKVLWVGIVIPPALLTLQKTVSDLLEAQGLPKDKFEGYNPHVTLGRFKQNPAPDVLAEFLAQHHDFQTPPISVDSFVVYRSERAANGAMYQEFERFPLQA
jgi:RNA 2',3'-cyclic 3'-phosphodiesterase